MDNVRENAPAEGFIFNGSFSASLEMAPMLKRMEKRLSDIRGAKDSGEDMSAAYEAYLQKNKRQHS